MNNEFPHCKQQNAEPPATSSKNLTGHVGAPECPGAGKNFGSQGSLVTQKVDLGAVRTSAPCSVRILRNNARRWWLW